MRYKEFNKNTVLKKSIPLFWANGFEACAISEIVNSTKVNRFSLYQEFNNKEGILLQCLGYYKKNDFLEKLSILDEKNKSVKQVFTDFIFSFLNEKSDRLMGCFILHTATELADNNEEVRVILSDYLDLLESHFIKVLQSFPETKNNSKFYARQLVGLFCTSMSFCLIHDEKERTDYVENGLNVILNKKFKNVSYA